MFPLRRVLAVACLMLGAVALATPAAGAGDHVSRLRLNGVIDQVNAAYIEEGIRAAAEAGAAAVLIEIDSPGGELTAMDDIIRAILGSPLPVITYVSAATFITLAGDVAAMAPSTSIGAASVVGSGGEDLPDTIKAKVTNSLVAKITDLAESHNRNAEWAEAAVRTADSASAADAVAMTPPIVDFVAADTAELFAAVDRGEREDGHSLTFEGAPLAALAGLPIRDVSMNLGQQFLHLLSDPNVALLLFTIGFYGIIAELFHPNFFSGIVGAIALVLAFIGSNSLPLNIGGLLLILIGIGMFALEINVTSYGLLTVGGAIAFLLGAFALWTGVNPEEQNISPLEVSPILLAAVLGLMLLLLFFIARGMIEIRRRASPTDPMVALVGASGTAQTLIAPTGIAYAGGESWSARSPEAEIAPGTPVRVVGVQGLELIVEPAGSTPDGRGTEDPSGVR